ncbi:uncharacterized protein G2W53_025701 [Senna tora]|uniref:Uncharacterized protein n=1 Tax=Senna tora TaxID=362788 RepID=A0A834TFP9_9FABA|nr:uncharacterized protein G2W53_025701 [Senna tora]
MYWWSACQSVQCEGCTVLSSNARCDRWCTVSRGWCYCDETRWATVVTGGWMRAFVIHYIPRHCVCKQQRRSLGPWVPFLRHSTVTPVTVAIRSGVIPKSSTFLRSSGGIKFTNSSTMLTCPNIAAT